MYLGSFSESEDEGTKLQSTGDHSMDMSESDDSGASSADSSPGEPMTVEGLLKKTKALPKSNVGDQLVSIFNENFIKGLLILSI